MTHSKPNVINQSWQIQQRDTSGWLNVGHTYFYDPNSDEQISGTACIEEFYKLMASDNRQYRIIETTVIIVIETGVRSNDT